MWLDKQYADEVRHFFGQHIKEPTLHDEVRPSERTSRALTALGRRLFWDPPEMIEKAAKLLLDDKKRQLIFYGPPGTGKTYVARALAKHLMGRRRGPTFLQFHPSYSYEDFFEGFRPVRARTAACRSSSSSLARLRASGQAANSPEGRTSWSSTRSTAPTWPRSLASSTSCWSTATRKSCSSTADNRSPYRRICCSSAR